MSTSKLQRYVSKQLGIYLAEYDIYENTRPQWLSGRELDFYIPEINTAIEVQGNQHFQFTPHFHRTYDAFLDQRHRDMMKRIDCEERGIKLYEVCTETDADVLIIDLFEKHHNKRSGGENDCLIIGPDPVQVEGSSNDQRHYVSLVRNAKNAIRKFLSSGKKDVLHVDKRVAVVVSHCRRYGVEFEDKDLLIYYEKRKEIIEAKITSMEEQKEAMRQRKANGTYGATAIPQPKNKHFRKRKDHLKNVLRSFAAEQEE